MTSQSVVFVLCVPGNVSDGCIARRETRRPSFYRVRSCASNGSLFEWIDCAVSRWMTTLCDVTGGSCGAKTRHWTMLTRSDRSESGIFGISACDLPISGAFRSCMVSAADWPVPSSRP